MSRQPYLSDARNDEWAIIKPLMPKSKPRGRKRTTNSREVVNGIYYILRSGGNWR